jgi:ribosomal protein L40E
MANVGATALAGLELRAFSRGKCLPDFCNPVSRSAVGPARVVRFFTVAASSVSMPVVCPSCGAQSPDGARSCAACGRRLTGPQAGALFLAEQQLGEIPRAFAIVNGIGPVRLVFTDQQIFIMNTGQHTMMPNRELYEEWKRASPAEAPWRFTEGPW